MTNKFIDFKYDDLNIKPIHNKDKTLEIIFSGTMFSNSNPNFSKYLNKLKKQLSNTDIEKVIVDFKKLNFMNSGGLKIILNWFKENEMYPKEKRYKIKITYDKDISWQELSFSYFITLFPNSIIGEHE